MMVVIANENAIKWINKLFLFVCSPSLTNCSRIISQIKIQDSSYSQYFFIWKPNTTIKSFLMLFWGWEIISECMGSKHLTQLLVVNDSVNPRFLIIFSYTIKKLFLLKHLCTLQVNLGSLPICLKFSTYTHIKYWISV